jgi:hypothetical protein
MKRTITKTQDIDQYLNDALKDLDLEGSVDLDALD